MKQNLVLLVFLVLVASCSQIKQDSSASQDQQVGNEYPDGFPYGNVPREKPNRPLSAAFNRVYDGTYTGLEVQTNELFSSFKYTPLKGFDYGKKDGTISRRDASKVILANGKYYVWYTHRHTSVPPRKSGGNDTIPSADWDLAEIWYATSDDGFAWEEQGVAVPRMEKPLPGWRSVATPDVLVYKGKYYLYYQAYSEMPYKVNSGKPDVRRDECPVAASVSDSPDGPWTPSNRVVLPNGPEGTWDQYIIHDPYPLVYNGKIYMYFKGEMGGGEKRVRAQGLAFSEDPFGPFEKHPLNPVINSGHETAMFPFKEGIAALVSRHGLEHNTIQYAPDGVNFKVAAITALLPIAPGAYVPDAYTDNGNGRGITWGLCHFRDVLKLGGTSQSYSILARFDCDLSLDIDDQEMKDSDIFNDSEINFKFGLSEKQRKRIEASMKIN